MQKGSAGRIHTQGQGAAPRCCTSLAAFHSPIPPSPTHISFVPPFPIPTFFCAALPGIPCATRQPALPHSSPSLLLSHRCFGICCSHRTKNRNGELPALGPSPFYSLWYWYSASRRQYQAKGGSIHACASPQLGAFYSITAIKNCPFKSFVLKISILATASADLLVGATAGGIVNSTRVCAYVPARGMPCLYRARQKLTTVQMKYVTNIKRVSRCI